MKEPTETEAEKQAALEEAVEETMKLYEIEGDVSKELYQRIDSLRQLINEEFVHRNKLVSSQFLYDMLNPFVAQERKKAAIEELERWRIFFGSDKDLVAEVDDRLAELRDAV